MVFTPTNIYQATPRRALPYPSHASRAKPLRASPTISALYCLVGSAVGFLCARILPVRQLDINQIRTDARVGCGYRGKLNTSLSRSDARLFCVQKTDYAEHPRGLAGGEAVSGGRDVDENRARKARLK